MISSAYLLPTDPSEVAQRLSAPLKCGCLTPRTWHQKSVDRFTGWLSIHIGSVGK